MGGSRGEAAFCSVVCALFLSPDMCFMNKNQFRARQDASLPPPPPTPPAQHKPEALQQARTRESITSLSLRRSRAYNADVFTAGSNADDLML